MTQLQTTELRLVTLLQSNIGMRHGAVRTQLVTMELIPQKSIIIYIFRFYSVYIFRTTRRPTTSGCRCGIEFGTSNRIVGGAEINPVKTRPKVYRLRYPNALTYSMYYMYT